MPAAHQSIRPCRMRSNERKPPLCTPSRAVGADATSAYCRKDAVVKKIDPMKKVMLSGVVPSAVA